MEHWELLRKSSDYLAATLELTGRVETYLPFAERVGTAVPVLAKLGVSMLNHTLKVWHFYTMFERAGKRIFRLSDNLALALHSTDIKGTYSDFLRSPFEAFYVAVNPALRLVQLDNDIHLSGIYVVHVGNYLSVMLAGIRPDGKDDHVTYMTLDLVGGGLVEDAINATFSHEEPILKLDKPRALAHVKAAVNLLINALFYISSPAADLSEPIYGEATRKLKANPKKGKEWQDKIGAHAKKEPIIIKVGQNVSFDKQATHEHGGPSYRFMVRGHWRRQAHGVGLTERSLKWIKPHVRGPSTAEVINRDFLVTN